MAKLDADDRALVALAGYDLNANADGTFLRRAKSMTEDQLTDKFRRMVFGPKDDLNSTVPAAGRENSRYQNQASALLRQDHAQRTGRQDRLARVRERPRAGDPASKLYRRAR